MREYIMACFTCKFWDRKWATTNNDEIRKGIPCQCMVPFALPSNSPHAAVIGKTQWDDGEGCPTWERFEGEVEFYTWPNE